MTAVTVRGEMVAIVVRCPLLIDRGHRLRGGWSGDPETRIVRCDFTVAYVPGSWSTFPNGLPQRNDEPAEDAMRRHLSDHYLEDIEAMA